MRFLVLGGVGAVLALEWGTLLWLPFLGGGFLLGTFRIDGEWADERMLARLRWRFGKRVPAARVDPGSRAARTFQTIGGELWAGLVAGGIPLAFLPAAEAEQLFAAYRDVLRRSDAAIYLRVGRGPIVLRPLPGPPEGRPAGLAKGRSGYAELLQLLLRRRRRREVHLFLAVPSGTTSSARLERNLEGFAAFFAAQGIPHRRLQGDELAQLLAPAVTVPAS